MKLTRIFFFLALLLMGCIQFASRPNLNIVIMMNGERLLLPGNLSPRSGFSLRKAQRSAVMLINLHPTPRWLLWAVNSLWSAGAFRTHLFLHTDWAQCALVSVAITLAGDICPSCGLGEVWQAGFSQKSVSPGFPPQCFEILICTSDYSLWNTNHAS